MAKFTYRMQNILDIKENLESQEKAAFGAANARLSDEQDKLQNLLVRKAGYENHLKELETGKLDVEEIRNCRHAIDSVKTMTRDQMVAVHTAQRNVELVRVRLNEVIKDRKTHENLKEKAFEEFKEELAADERKTIDELVSYNYHNKSTELE
jgi:flagellar FliJ protein